MPQAGLEFTEKTHTYREDGGVIPSVSQVLTLAGVDDVSGIPEHILRHAADRGTAVHLACHYLDEDDLIFDSLDQEVLPYVVAYQKFREEYEFKATVIEHRMVGEVDGMRYGMTLDRVGTMTTPEGTYRVLLDLKTASKPQAYWPIQTAAYLVGYAGIDTGARPGRAVVHLRKDATFKVLVHDLDTDFDIWRSALTLAHWKIKNGSKIK